MMQSGQGYAALRPGVCCNQDRGMLQSGQGYAAIRPGVCCNQARGVVQSGQGYDAGLTWEELFVHKFCYTIAF